MRLPTEPCHWFLMGMILSLRGSCRGSEEDGAAVATPSSDVNEPEIRTTINLEIGTNETVPLSLTRKRRFVRFPTAGAPPGYAYEPSNGRTSGYPGYYGPQPQFQQWRQQKSFWRGPPTAPDYPRPVMSHRTPRLIFRDNDFPVNSAGSFFQSNQLQDVDEEIRDHRKQIYNDYPRLETESRIRKRPVWQGDDSLCVDGGSCEFFLVCWMSAGLLDGSCGGIMYACCRRKDAKTSTDYNLIEAPREQSQLLPLDSYADATSDDRCGISVSKQTAQRRIVGGDDAGFGNFPWQAYIRIGSSRCGGTLVNRYHVVTAGHCVAKASARQVQVTLGDYVVNSATESLPAYTFGVREIRVHPYFKFTPQADRFDVAVLRLDRPVHYMPHIAPICLPEKNEDFLGQYGWAAGWGALQAGSRLRPKTLQAVDVPVIDNRVCERWHRSNGINVIIYDEMMCAGYRGGGKDSCQGDSGGPLMLEKTGRWYLIGIVSAGYSCAQPGQPGIYHRVAKTVDWITYVINS
ncbi:proclotting enzyme isoform X1 [Orussus abietinus]|uniref:proclotting enzyme isoform X1 n=1 Tax=Orussus abietinus TaxID=222816 RepID=UPI000626EBC8|nr:proclotting enzyme isoform X1 [Orussus abietinus]XP_012277053.1 proclotting enzyme isoform X1 [Orussus abietinus]